MDEIYMGLALEEACKAFSTYEVPVGAVIVHDGKVISKGYNKRETLKDPTAHAEIIAIREASNYLGGWRLVGCTMYVTLEPCSMCAGAIINSRIERLVIGAKDSKRGCCGSVINLLDNPYFNHKVEVEFGILEDKCSSILTSFFKQIRSK
ncbi:tRNA adenosine(34) deaminase TadA [Clostridium sp. Cult1]|jgi:tRNA(adenine34) deaminase|uniref:tRNA adenosine(34) deaminase TadA n=1 Tax=Clostridium sp. Cult1 TaxID=2079002 RepID=UPI001F02E084|nr:tRNA adenosine(34) deaminase TadA [Clostridium sp. Cult1]MCF6462784.1 tRNA adenosine(34) deaminase TadA [Clostridium sp. Cult1]